uniref:Bifunctional inhibitor/plant lipid transfer protein/seed storage helical domain-containing protein n=1 Tax=Arundo donax TaxID=35708 RepID=A0A0A9AER8_ARUDO
MSSCPSYCRNNGGKKGSECCDALRNADVGCLCRNYWSGLQWSPYYARCAAKIQSSCGIKGCSA